MIRKIRYRTLQVFYNNFTNSCDAILQINNDISIHQKHLTVEVYKAVVEM